MPQRRKGACNGCGDCCRVLHCAWNKTSWLKPLPDEEAIGRANRLFVTRNWHRIPRREAQRRMPDIIWEAGGFFYECDAFDAETNQCLAYTFRPPICSGYPWYDNYPELPDRGTVSASRLHNRWRCGFWLDVPAKQRPSFVRMDEIIKRSKERMKSQGERAGSIRCGP